MSKPLMTKTVPQLLEENAKNYASQDAMVYVDRNMRLSHAELNEKANRVARALLALGIKKGDHVAVWATNYPEWLFAFLGASKIGAVLVTVNTNYKIFELEYLLSQSDSKILFFIQGLKDSNYVDILNELVPEVQCAGHSLDIESDRLPLLKHVVYIPRFATDPIPDGYTSWQTFEAMADTVELAAMQTVRDTLECEEIINMQYTSGTTGFPKGVMLTHRNIVNNGFFIGENMKFTDRDRLCIPVPFFHCFGLVLAYMASLTHGATIVPVEHFSPTAVLGAVEAERCTALHGVPTMFIFELEHPDFEKYDLSSLRTGIMAGASCPVKVMDDVRTKMNMSEIVISYGMTETSPVTTMTNTEDSVEKRVNTVGRAMPHAEIKLINPDTGATVGPNTQGELCVRGYSVMKGYYKMADATKNAIDEDGWMHSGDLAMMDDDGYFKITGRIKDMIIRGGENIYPREIEELYYTHPDIQDVQVIGVPSKEFGEEVMAWIIPREGTSLTEDSCKDFVRKNMSRHKVPSYIYFTNTFPMTASGKIQKYKMREEAVTLLNLQDAASIETA